jgi:CHAT domain-containing protein
VPWLVRTHMVTTVPSASALRGLRRLPPGSDGRDSLAAFGDPFFNEQQAAEAGPEAPPDEGAATRGIALKRRSVPQTEGADSADLGSLPRLPDTADELRSIALALAADPDKALHLGKEANEQAVKKMNLTGYRIVAFATHGLMPGDLDGLTQPALALSSPAVAGVEGDGLLTMDEILSLRLDADWVVLSACNSGGAAAVGAEAASGLGRAFFYAGTRAVLVTNWAVYSEPARELVSDLFRRQAHDPALTRSEALQQAMMALLDEGGEADADGNLSYTYGHPVFWAPYTLIGEGGRS